MWTTISELIGRDGVFTDGDWIESKDQDPGGDVRLIQLADVGDGVYLDKSSRFLTAKKSHELKCTYLVPGDVLIARMPDPLGRACIYPGDLKTSVTAVDVCIVRTGVNGPDHHWLAWFINSPEFRANVASLQSGSTRKRISRKNLATIALPLPPLPEQHRIVAEIEKHFTRLDASVAALNRVQANLKRYRASVLKAACEGKLVPTEAELARAEGRDYEPADRLLERVLAERRARWESQENPRGKYKEPVAPDTTDLPELPEGWMWATVDQLMLRSPQNGIYKPKSQYGDGVPVLRIEDYQDFHVRGRNQLQRLRISADEASTYGLASGELVINRVNSLSHLGKTLLVPDHLPPAVFESNMMKLVPSDGVAPSFVAHYLRSTVGRVRLTARAKWAVNQASINQSDVRMTSVPLPPLVEQHRIVAEIERHLSVVQQTEATVEASLTRAERMRQSILKQAFSGKLVPQEPNDEPASLLLERIHAEREAAEAAAKAQRKPRRRGSKATRTASPKLSEAAR